MAPILSRNQRIFARELVRQTGLDPRLVGAWIISEQPAGAAHPVGHSDQNWLNIGLTDTRWYGGGSAWQDPATAAARSAAWLQGKQAVPGFGKAASGIVNFSRTAGQPLQNQIRALQQSGWASSGYPDLPNVVQQNAGKYGINLHGSVPPSASGAGPQFQQMPRSVFDQQGFDDARRQFALGQILQRVNSPFKPEHRSSLLSFLPQEAPAREDYTSAVSSLRRMAGGLKVVEPGAASGGSGARLPRGVAKFEGAPVAAWIAPILQYARQRGWRGSINSGFRSYAEQKRIYDSGVRPAAVPGTSNHEGDVFPRGAVDVSDAETLARILARSPYRRRLVWAGSKDPVHFSHPHDGSY